jgi:hypothetical protein
VRTNAKDEAFYRDVLSPMIEEADSLFQKIALRTRTQVVKRNLDGESIEGIATSLDMSAGSVIGILNSVPIDLREHFAEGSFKMGDDGKLCFDWGSTVRTSESLRKIAGGMPNESFLLTIADFLDTENLEARS